LLSRTLTPLRFLAARPQAHLRVVGGLASHTNSLIYSAPHPYQDVRPGRRILSGVGQAT